ncbi:YfiR family protein [Roseateles saccharophilus]|uniref:Uncharacterized protein DUF4154 n=1 Tax=Roseateles saccharophilus TaxID=304 RepID=A0A4R3UJK0_ROSSA|nr:YfiR family protein [Roseateles saccharophilus]MDG0834439.1 YfiR family protein [Roseateles saccharophilus]TCU89849.1 uncharacterized protein DUF4154 [Roseateles saccharophilus]
MTRLLAIPSSSARWRRRLGCALLAWLSCAGPALAQTGGPEALKAEVVYRLLMFVSWPAEREQPGHSLQLCTLGEGRMEGALQGLAGRQIRQLTLDVRRMARGDSPAGCHLLYLPAPQAGLRTQLAELPVLVVSDVAAMFDQGAMVNLQVEDGRIVFDVDLDAARHAGLGVSAKLLRLARYVRHQGGAP